MADDGIKASTGMADIFNVHERGRIKRFRRFLTEMMAPDLAPQAAGVGYGAVEHDQAWEKLDIVEGRGLSFNDALGVARRAEMIEGNSMLNDRIHYLDSLENRWFGRFRQAIVRYVGADDLEAFQAAFWEDLQQQPEGPGVLASMGKLCDRYEALATNETRGARELHAALERRGFNAELIADIRGGIEKCRTELPTTPAPLPNEEKLLQVARERREAYGWLNSFYNDWATTLRTELTYHQAVRLGITEVKGGRKPDEALPDEESGDSQ